MMLQLQPQLVLPGCDSASFLPSPDHCPPWRKRRLRQCLKLQASMYSMQGMCIEPAHKLPYKLHKVGDGSAARCMGVIHRSVAWSVERRALLAVCTNQGWPAHRWPCRAAACWRAPSQLANSAHCSCPSLRRQWAGCRREADEG